MSDRIEDQDQNEQRPSELSGGDVLGVLAISTFLAAIGLVTFFVTAALGR